MSPVPYLTWRPCYRCYTYYVDKAKIKAIRKLRKSGISYQDISDKLNIPRSTVRRYSEDIHLSPKIVKKIKTLGHAKSGKSNSKTTSTHKYCASCKRNLPHSDFYIRNNGYLTGYCKVCQSVYAVKRNSDHYAKLRKLIDDLKNVPCKDCGKSFAPFAMDFDHRDPGKKCFDISQALRNNYSIKKVKEEVAKCDVVCAVCHRYRTFM